MDQSTAAPRRPLTLGKRLYRGVFFALLVGFVGAAVSVIPAMFVQSIFISNVEACDAMQQEDIAQYGEVRTSCVESLDEEPAWLPAAMITGGGLVGIIGGFGYGFVSPRSWKDRHQESDRSWLPF